MGRSVYEVGRSMPGSQCDLLDEMIDFALRIRIAYGKEHAGFGFKVWLHGTRACKYCITCTQFARRLIYDGIRTTYIFIDARRLMIQIHRGQLLC